VNRPTAKAASAKASAAKAPAAKALAAKALAAKALAAPALVAVAVMAALGLVPAGASVAGTADRVWYVSHAPKLRLDVAAGCPTSVAAYQDVVNTFPGPPMVPARPKSGLICRYGPSMATPRPARLERQTRLDPGEASLLAATVRQLDLKPPAGVSSCPADFGVVAVIAFSYAGRPDTGLWYHASGCQSLDNGRIGAFEGGNPSFYNRFLNTVDRLSPPVNI
jgi:hypothetical protein